MKMKRCPHCNGSGVSGYEGDPDSGLPGSWNDLPCYICEGTGEIPDEPVSRCQACGLPVELGLEWCDHHRPAADLWQALNQEQLQKIANACIAIAEPTLHLDEDGNEISWCYDHNERAITDGRCTICLAEDNPRNKPS